MSVRHWYDPGGQKVESDHASLSFVTEQPGPDPPLSHQRALTSQVFQGCLQCNPMQCNAIQQCLWIVRMCNDSIICLLCHDRHCNNRWIVVAIIERAVCPGNCNCGTSGEGWGSSRSQVKHAPHVPSFFLTGAYQHCMMHCSEVNV